MSAEPSGPRQKSSGSPAPTPPDPHRSGGEPGPHLPPYEDPRDEKRPADRQPEKRQASRAFAIAAFLAAPLALSAAAPAQAESCLEQLERFARQYDLSTTAPQAQLRAGDPVTPPSSPMTTESRGMSASDKLKDSGGVIEPPAIGTARVIEPPATGDKMSTAPDVAPQTGSGQAAGSSGAVGAADRSQLEALLMAGREAAENGRDAACMERLGEARDLLEPKSR